MNAKSRIMICGPKNDGTRTAHGEALTINVPAGETRVLKHFTSSGEAGPP
jgi:hypothetical protein